ncbi:MAG: hypothetical protein KBT88_03525 [Gammaproteobacteria bacterium]|nr:hypothetical protein [Gammaproteobacteria bacterium]MBQ0838831.1 hypothetical protein [Gammaproteobacteria bacterium]
MAIHPRPVLPNKNTLYLARSGGGKSQAMKQNPQLPKSGGRVILWDKSHDHKAHHYDNKKAFTKAIKLGLKSGKGFRIAFSGGVDIADFEWFCSVVWVSLDGNRLTYVIAEELSEVCASVGKASPFAARLLNQGRKYGMIFHGTSQKPQEISKTYYDQCPFKWIGPQIGANIKKFAKEIGGKDDDIKALDDLEFLVWDGRQAVKKALKYKK